MKATPSCSTKGDVAKPRWSEDQQEEEKLRISRRHNLKMEMLPYCYRRKAGTLSRKKIRSFVAPVG